MHIDVGCDKQKEDVSMCELYGFSGKREKELNSDLNEFYSHALYHPNGWGLALFDEEKAMIFREPKRADKSERLKQLLRLPRLYKTALAHIRLATIGNIEYDNCHPFTAEDESGRAWTLIHNGTVFESEKLNRYIFTQKGETDSERIMLYIIDSINKAIYKLGRTLSAKERFAVLDGIVCASSQKNKLNLLIYDGEILYAHTNFRNSLYFRKDNDGITFSTQPICGGAWENVPFTTLIGCKNGEIIFSGKNHGNEYFYDPAAYKPLYMAFAGL